MKDDAEKTVCRSARQWVVGSGDVGISEARRLSIVEVEEAESELAASEQALTDAQAAFRRANQDLDTAADRMKNARDRLLNARRRALYRLSSSSDVSRPESLRGPDHDLTDYIIDPKGEP